MYMRILMILGCLCSLSVEAASLWDSLFEASGYKQVSSPTKSIVELPIPIPLGRYAKQEERRVAEDQRQKALFYKDGWTPEKYPKDEKKALLCFHTAAQYGEPTSCTLLADFYRTGRYGLGPDEERARMYETNIQWWSPRAVPQALPAADDDTFSLDAEAARRASGDSDQSSNASISATGVPVSELRHRKLPMEGDS